MYINITFCLLEDPFQYATQLGLTKCNMQHYKAS